MKFEKGKLSKSNAVVIAVLLVVFYIVIPRGPQKKGSAPSDQSMNANVSNDSSPGLSDPNQADQSPDGQQQKGVQNNPEDAVGTETISSTVRPLSEIDHQKLQEIAGRSPFSTTIVNVPSVNPVAQDTHANTSVEPPSDDTALAATMESNSSVKLYYSSSTGRQAAVLNDEIVYRGSVLADRLTVESIRPDGVRIRRATTPPEFGN